MFLSLTAAYLTLGGEPGRPGSSAIRQCHLGTPKIPCHKFGSPVSRFVFLSMIG